MFTLPHLNANGKGVLQTEIRVPSRGTRETLFIFETRIT